MQEQLNKYDIFYKQKHQNRRLEYDHSLGTATLSGQFKPGVKDLAVSLYQAVILLQFNDASELSFTFLKQSIRMGASLILRDRGARLTDVRGYH